MEAEPAQIQRPRRSYTFLLAANMTWIFGVFLYSNFIGLYMREELGANSVQVGYWSTVFLLSMLFFVALGGFLTNRLGEKRTMLIGWLVIIPAPLLYLFAITWQMALIGAILEGASMIAMAPFGAYITSISGGSRRGRAFGGVSASTALGGIPSPVLGGTIINLFGYEILFLIAAILFVLSTLIILPISNIPTTREERSEQRSWEFLKNRVFIFLTMFWFTVSALYWVANMFVPLLLFDRWGLIEAQIGALGSIANASGAVLGPLVGWVGDRWSYTGALVFPVLGTFGFYGLLLLSPTAAFLPLIYALYGFIHCFSLNNAILSHNIPRGQLPDALSSYNLIGRSLSPLSPVIGGVAFAISPTLPLIISSTLMPIPLALLAFLRRAEKQIKKPADAIEGEPKPISVEDKHPTI